MNEKTATFKVQNTNKIVNLALALGAKKQKVLRQKDVYNLGNQQVIVEKYVEPYNLGVVELLIETVKSLGRFVKIQAPTEQELKEYCDKFDLKFEDDDYNEISYADILLASKGLCTKLDVQFVQGSSKE